MDVKKTNRTVATILIAITAVVLAIEGTWGIPLLHSPLTHSLTHSFTHSLTHSFTHSLTHSFTHSLIHSLIPTLLLISIAIYLYRLPSKVHTIFSHAGFFLVILAAIASHPWVESGQAIVKPSTPTRLAYTPQGQPMALPFELKLDTFYIDYYEDGISPKQYTSHLTVHGLTDKDTTTQNIVTSVNHPAHYHGYHLYQDSYDRNHQSFVVIKVVRQPLYWLTLIGFALLAIGAVLYTASKWQSSWFIVIAIALAIIFTLIAVARIRFGTLMPALRSLWFIPHLIIYMLAYAILALTMILYIIKLICTHHNHHIPLAEGAWGCQGLLVTASSLLLLGMLCGAVWAQQAWGDYWAWDPKECWAAATWMLTLAAIHTKTKTTTSTTTTTTTASAIIKTIFVVLAFVAMNITWYGVNHLPSAPTSIHTYNK